jgi:hypothetical protein
MTSDKDNKKKTVQYGFALDNAGKLTHISDIDQNMNNSFVCSGCGQEMIAALGEVNAHHFRHKNTTCSYETYLHQAAKLAFFEMFYNCLNEEKTLSITLNRQLICKSNKLKLSPFADCSSIGLSKYNLVSLFTKAELETHDKATGFKPDVLLTNPQTGHKCYAEIFVTHKCPDEKINSGIPIIEFDIKSEIDIKYILNGEYAESEYLTFYNFNPKPKLEDSCHLHCSLKTEKFNKWWLGKNGRLRQEICSYSNCSEADFSLGSCWPLNVFTENEYELLVNLVRSQDKNNQFYNCLKCSHCEGWNDGEINCKVKGVVHYTMASECLHYTGNDE